MLRAIFFNEWLETAGVLIVEEKYLKDITNFCKSRDLLTKDALINYLENKYIVYQYIDKTLEYDLI